MMGNYARPYRRRALLLIGTILLTGFTIALTGLGRLLAPKHEGPVNDPYAQYCTSILPAAQVAGDVPASHVIKVTVPSERTSSVLEDSLRTIHIRKGDVVEFQVYSPSEGAVSVHGMTSLAVLKPGILATLRFRAYIPGRFPLHFHGSDHSHFEIYALYVQ